MKDAAGPVERGANCIANTPGKRFRSSNRSDAVSGSSGSQSAMNGRLAATGGSNADMCGAHRSRSCGAEKRPKECDRHALPPA
jgi:hypothetical protein